VIAAKTTDPNPKLPGTIFSAAAEIEKAGGKALPIQCDIRDEKSVQAAIDATVAKFGGIDILINNASAIALTPTDKTDMKRYDLIHSINTRGTFLVSKLALPHLKKATNPHILNISPPLGIFDHGVNWFAPHCAYTMAKYGMTLCAYGMSEEFAPFKIGVNTLWPRTAIATAAVQNLLGGDASIKMSRKPEIMADAAYEILTSKSDEITGKYFMDDEVLISGGAMELSKYACVEGTRDDELLADYFC
jgi:citronellol/citronellal dehydrogenase